MIQGKGFKFDKLNEFAEPVDGAYLVPKPLGERRNCRYHQLDHDS